MEKPMKKLLLLLSIAALSPNIFSAKITQEKLDEFVEEAKKAKEEDKAKISNMELFSKYIITIPEKPKKIYRVTINYNDFKPYSVHYRQKNGKIDITSIESAKKEQEMVIAFLDDMKKIFPELEKIKIEWAKKPPKERTKEEIGKWLKRDEIEEKKEELFQLLNLSTKSLQDAYLIRKIAKLAQDLGDLNFQDKKGYTPLHYVSEKKAPHLVSAFVSLGSDVYATTKDGLTPLDISRKKKDEASITFLEEYIKANPQKDKPKKKKWKKRKKKKK